MIMKKTLFSLAAAFLIFLTSSVALSQEPDIKVEVELVSAPTSPLSKNWQFIVDTSPSTRFVFPKLREALTTVMNQAVDEFNFSVITFNLQNMEATKPWVEASVNEFKAADEFVIKNYGALSYGFKALEMGIKQEKSPLTIVLITDGGFTEVCRNNGNFALTDNVVDKAQQWRRDRDLPAAQILCVGLENKQYTHGHKPPDEQCQAYLKGLGERFGGGYVLVRNK